MQTGRRGNLRNRCVRQPYSLRINFIIALFILVFSSDTYAQGKVVDQVRDLTKKINLTVGTPIVNDTTERVLRVIDKIQGISRTIHRYNERYGNDSVHATRFVDREPDEKAIDTLIKNYYDVVVVSDSVNQTSRWYSFLVRKDLKEVRYYDLKNGKTGNMDDWKKIWPASEFLKGRN